MDKAMMDENMKVQIRNLEGPARAQAREFWADIYKMALSKAVVLLADETIDDPTLAEAGAQQYKGTTTLSVKNAGLVADEALREWLKRMY